MSNMFHQGVIENLDGTCLIPIQYSSSPLSFLPSESFICLCLGSDPSRVTFEGSSEDYKEHDAVLFFDGEKFRLERLHRAVKQLRHLRTPGESAAASSQAAMPVEHNRLSPVDRAAKSPQVNRSLLPDVPVEVERIEIGKPENSG
ncbi:hypothetical protein ARALYDRAFT_337082 [Arabidopsis lyrata subsp. lyrata]|uniref:Transcription elongation factor Eaf N-terminal domain-containing protein n=1 Tax=Arabidopsis lyrata subsp. lyrata TaxID=81972 RepID=D7KEV8_ARALL|nr:hypothetical protein ARALYDRAFT_337082 [Arabidopsis lyrata subsp. lyrata]